MKNLGNSEDRASGSEGEEEEGWAVLKEEGWDGGWENVSKGQNTEMCSCNKKQNILLLGESRSDGTPSHWKWRGASPSCPWSESDCLPRVCLLSLSRITTDHFLNLKAAICHLISTITENSFLLQFTSPSEQTFASSLLPAPHCWLHPSPDQQDPALELLCT